MITYNFIKTLIYYIKYCKILKAAYYKEGLLKNLNMALNTEFSMDWVGRLYTVLNSNILAMNDDSVSGSSSIIYEFTVDGSLSDRAHIEKWIMDRMNFLNMFIQQNSLFDIITYTLTKIDDNGNWLLVLEPLNFQDMKKWTKRFITLLAAIIIILITLFIIF